MRHFCSLILVLFCLPITLAAQQFTKVDFKTLDAIVDIQYAERKVSGTIAYTFDVLTTIDTIKIDAVKMSFSDVKVNGKVVKFKSTDKALLLFEGFKKGKNTLSIHYVASPKQTMYFTGLPDNFQIWTQGQGKYTSHWLPSFDDMNEKVVFNMTVAFDKNYEVLSNGVLDKKVASNDKISWEYSMHQPMSSYLVMLAIGKFNKRSATASSGTPLEMYLSAEDDAKFEATYRYTKDIFDFLEKEIGVSYPWKVYRQVPVKDFLYGGMENTTATVFTQDYVVDDIGYNDRNYVNVNAHELAHQWFGDMITAKSGKHHWLQEGFATYYALLAEQSLFGDDHFYKEMYQMAEDLQRASKSDTIPILNEKASSLTFYRKGAWALHVLREGVGHEQFRKAVQNYLSKYSFKNVETDDFLKEINKVSNFNTRAFKKDWLETGGFNISAALQILKQNKSMQQYFTVVDMQNVPFAEKKDALEKSMRSNAYFSIKEEVILQIADVPFEEKQQLIILAMQSNDVKIRQAVAKTLLKVPESFYETYRTLLQDKSYLTQEIAMQVIWQQFPDNQFELLNQTRNNIGFNDKNLRIQWLTMALITKGFEEENKVLFYDELLNYAKPEFESSIRQNALANLLFLNASDSNVLPLLISPLTHHKWQFSKFARDNIRELIKKPSAKNYFRTLLPTLQEPEYTQLKRLIE